jgi:ribosomal protein S18 acetylase RimI-like enzyme
MTNTIVFRIAAEQDLSLALKLLKEAAETLKDKGINQWTFWQDPSEEKINWIKQGFENNEFYFVENLENELVAMFRLMSEDELYWGKQTQDARYIHSLVVRKQFSGQQIGQQIMQQIESNLIERNVFILRLDCNASSKGLCAYYEKLDFVKVGEKQMPHSLNHLYEKKLLNVHV